MSNERLSVHNPADAPDITSVAKQGSIASGKTNGSNEIAYEFPSNTSADPVTFDDLKEDCVSVVEYPRYINVYVNSEPGMHVRSWVDDDRIVHFVINTTREDGVRHEYFERHRASEIAGRAIGCFSEAEPLEGVSFDWGNSNLLGGQNDNFAAYITTRNKIVESGGSSAEAKLQGVKSSWTYNMIGKPNGFTKISSADDVIELGDPSNPRGILGVLRREV